MNIWQLLFFATFTPRLIDAACYEPFRVHGNHLNGIFSQTFFFWEVSLSGAPQREREIERAQTKCKKNMQKRNCFESYSLVSCNLPHEPVYSICIDCFVVGFFSLLLKATFKLIQIHVCNRYRHANWILFICDSE